MRDLILTFEVYFENIEIEAVLTNIVRNNE